MLTQQYALFWEYSLDSQFKLNGMPKRIRGYSFKLKQVSYTHKVLNRFLFGLNIDFRLLGAQNDVVSISSVSSLDALLWLSWNSCNLRSKLADRSCSCFIAFCNLRSSFCDSRFALSSCRTCKQIKKIIVNPLIAKNEISCAGDLTFYIILDLKSWSVKCVPRTVATL